MLKGKPIGMQRLPLQSRKGGSAVKQISQQRMPKTRHVHADLMRSAGLQGAFNEAAGIAIAKGAYARGRRLSGVVVQVNDGHSKPVARIAPHRCIYLHDVVTAPAMVSNGQILAADQPRTYGLH